MECFTMGIDIGTTSVKAVLVSSQGYILGETSISHDLLSLHPNWAEEDAMVWWDNVKKAIQELGKKYPKEMKEIACVGCSGMVPAIVLLDENQEPLRKTIQQNDARAIAEIEQIKRDINQEMLFEKTGGTTNQQHILPRLLWVKEHEPEIWKQVKHILGSYDFIALKLTGTLSIELNWAAESGAFDIHKKEWLQEELKKFDISQSLFPPVNESMCVIGRTMQELEEIGITKGTPVIAGSADHVASTLSAGIIKPGDLLIKFGGAGDILYCVNKIETNRRLFFDYHIVPNHYLINGCMASSGSLVKWFIKDIIHSDSKDIFRELDQEASSVPPASEGLIVLPYFLGEKTPIFDPTARGVFFGLTLSHTNGHIFKAILESVIYGFRHHIEVIQEMGHTPRKIIATNGGAKSEFWCQIAADILGQPICSYPTHPGSALGVAFLAGMSVGIFQSWDEIDNFLTDYKLYEPNKEAVKTYNKSYDIYRELYKNLQPSFEKLTKLYVN